MDASSVGDEWNSGEALTVTLIDQDLNKNTASSEDLYLVNTTNGQLVPSLQIGNPLMITTSADDVEGVTSVFTVKLLTTPTHLHLQSLRSGVTANFSIDTGYTGTNLDAIDTVNTYFNYDFSVIYKCHQPCCWCLFSGWNHW